MKLTYKIHIEPFIFLIIGILLFILKDLQLLIGSIFFFYWAIKLAFQKKKTFFDKIALFSMAGMSIISLILYIEVFQNILVIISFIFLIFISGTLYFKELKIHNKYEKFIKFIPLFISASFLMILEKSLPPIINELNGYSITGLDYIRVIVFIFSMITFFATIIKRLSEILFNFQNDYLNFLISIICFILYAGFKLIQKNQGEDPILYYIIGIFSAIILVMGGLSSLKNIIEKKD